MKKRRKKHEELNQKVKAEGTTVWKMEVSADSVYKIGEEMRYDNGCTGRAKYGLLAKITEDIRFTVLSAEVSDVLPAEIFSLQYFINEMGNWTNADTSLKDHQRYRVGKEEELSRDEVAERGAETVGSKYVIVKMKAKKSSRLRDGLE